MACLIYHKYSIYLNIPLKSINYRLYKIPLLPLNMAFKILKWRFSRAKYHGIFQNGQAALSHIRHGLSQAFPGPFAVSFRGGVCCLGD